MNTRKLPLNLRRLKNSFRISSRQKLAWPSPSQAKLQAVIFLNSTITSCKPASIYSITETWMPGSLKSAGVRLNYKILFVPGVAVMDEATASKIREFVKNGGTVIMTSNSAIVDESGQVFATTRPGRLSDVFGIRLGSYEETEMMNEMSRKSYKGKKLDFTYKGKTIETESTRFDIVEPKGAEVIGSLTSLDKDYPIMTLNRYGKGRAIYVGLPANGDVLNPLVDELISELGIKKGPEVPSGVMARQIDKNHFLYLNVSGEPKEIPMKGNSRSILFDKDYTGKFTLAPYEPEFIEIK